MFEYVVRDNISITGIDVPGLFQPYPLDVDCTMYVAQVPVHATLALEALVSNVIGEDVRPIATFFRANKAKLDTSTRIHSDDSILGRKPKYAAVLFLHDTPGYGTALLSHPVHGNRGSGVFKEDSEWNVDTFVEGKKGRLLVYSADMFHSRWPAKAFGDNFNNGRIVLVSFLK